MHSQRRSIDDLCHGCSPVEVTSIIVQCCLQSLALPWSMCRGVASIDGGVVVVVVLVLLGSHVEVCAPKMGYRVQTTTTGGAGSSWTKYTGRSFCLLSNLPKLSKAAFLVRQGLLLLLHFSLALHAQAYVVLQPHCASLLWQGSTPFLPLWVSVCHFLARQVAVTAVAVFSLAHRVGDLESLFSWCGTSVLSPSLLTASPTTCIASSSSSTRVGVWRRQTSNFFSLVSCFAGRGQTASTPAV